MQDERQKVSTEQLSELHVTTTFTSAHTASSSTGGGGGGGGGGGSDSGAYVTTNITSTTSSGLHASVLLEAELAAESTDTDVAEFADLTSDDDALLCDAIDKHLLMLVDWARHLPPFTLLSLADQVTLLRSG